LNRSLPRTGALWPPPGAEKPDLILCDVMMPDLDGYGVLAALRADAGPPRHHLSF
jgi:CheY-like chemotaxis protein